MPYIVITTWWPPDKTREVVDKAVELFPRYPLQPSLGEQVVPNAVKGSKKGLVNMSIIEVKEGKLEEAIAWNQKYLVEYNSIVGYKYSLEIWATGVEAFAAIGMTPPE